MMWCDVVGNGLMIIAIPNTWIYNYRYKGGYSTARYIFHDVWSL